MSERVDILIPEFEEYLQTNPNTVKRYWNAWEEDVLKEYYGKIPIEMLSKKLNRTTGAISRKVCALGLTTKHP